MRKIYSVIIIITLIFTISACCASTDKEKTPEVNKAETYVETKAQEFSINNVADVNYSGAIKYNPYSEGTSNNKLVVYFSFKNTSDKNIKPSDVLILSATQGNNILEQYQFEKEYSAAEYDDFYKECKPNETITCCSYWTLNDDKTGVAFKISEKQTNSETLYNIDTAKLDIVKQTLNTEIATETE